MATTYTFPTYHLASGDMQIVLSVFDGGSSNTNLTERYFDQPFAIHQQSELEGGDLFPDSIDFTVSYDANDLFSGTVYNALLTGVTALLTISTGGKYYLFVPDIRTFRVTPWYSANPDGSYSKKSMKFAAVWITKALMNLSIQTFNTTILPYQQHVDDSFSHDTFFFVYLDKLFEAMMSWIQTNYGVTISVQWLNQQVNGATALRMFSAGSNEVNTTVFHQAVTGSGDYAFPQDMAIPTGYRPASSSTSPSNMMSLSSGEFNNVYEIYRAILNGFGLVVKFSFSSATVGTMTVMERVSGQLRNPSSLLTLSIDKAVLEYRDAADVNSYANQFHFQQKKWIAPTSPFSASVEFDLAQGSQGNQLFAPARQPGGIGDTGIDMNFIKHICYGQSIIPNALDTYSKGLTNWTVDSGVWTMEHTNRKQLGGDAGHAQFAYDGATVGKIYTDSMPSGYLDGYGLLVFWVHSTNGGTVGLKVYQDGFDPDTVGTGPNYSGFITTVTNAWRLIIVRYPYTYPNTYGWPAPKVWLSFSPVGLPAHNINITEVQLYKSYESVPEYLGRKILSYFGNAANEKITARYSGIQDAEVSDYITYGGAIGIAGTKFFVKSVKRDFTAHETEVEAINYQW